MLSLLLRARDEDGEPMTDVELRDELMTMLAAGHETTATGLAFAFDLLLRNPASLDAPARRARRRRRRLPRRRGHRDAAPAPGDRRGRADAEGAADDRRLGPAGRASASTRRSRSSTGARTSTRTRDAFRPERFLDGEAESYTWLPFGGGIRRCIGAALAQAEMAEVLRVILKRVELAPVSPRTDQVVLRGITLAPKDGVRMRVTTRATPSGASRRAVAAVAG